MLRTQHMWGWGMLRDHTQDAQLLLEVETVGNDDCSVSEAASRAWVG